MSEGHGTATPSPAGAPLPQAVAAPGGARIAWPADPIGHCNALLQRGCLEQAATVLERHLVAHPGDLVALNGLGRVRLRQGRAREAARLFERVLGLSGRAAPLDRTSLTSRATRPATAAGMGTSDPDAPQEQDLAAARRRARSIEAGRRDFDPATLEPEPGAPGGPPAREPASGASGAEEERSATGPTQASDWSEALPPGHLPPQGDEPDGTEPPLPEEADLDLPAAPLLSPSGAEAAPSPCLWDLDVDPPEFDEDVETGADLGVDVGGRVERGIRALQTAIELGRRYGWSRGGIELLARIFELHGWSACKRSMERELEAGLTPDELALAVEVRTLWAAHPEFSIAIGGYGYPVLSWPVALACARSFGDAYPDPAEIEALLCEAYDDWRAAPRLVQKFASFYGYLRYRLGMTPGSLSEPAWIGFDEDGGDGWTTWEYLETGLESVHRTTLQDLGLIPDVWSDRFRYVPPPVRCEESG